MHKIVAFLLFLKRGPFPSTGYYSSRSRPLSDEEKVGYAEYVQLPLEVQHDAQGSREEADGPGGLPPRA